MGQVTLKGMPIHVAGSLIAKGMKAPDFTMIKGDLSSLSLSDLKGKKVLLNIFPSLDTPVCATSVRKFNQMASQCQDTVVLAISKDLPFAQSRFCTTEGIENVIALSDYRAASFGADYGVMMQDGPLSGLLARAVVVVDEQGEVIYSQLVPEITQEPDYDSAIAVLK